LRRDSNRVPPFVTASGERASSQTHSIRPLKRRAKLLPQGPHRKYIGPNGTTSLAMPWDLLFNIVLFLSAILWLYLGLRVVWRVRASRKWPSVNGSIVSREIRRAWFSGEYTTHSPEVTYRFTVSGKEYTGNVIQFGLLKGDERKAQSILGPYTVGSPVLVYYFPDNPCLSVLQAGPGSAAWAFIAAGCLGLCFAALVLIWGKGVHVTLFWILVDRAKQSGSSSL